ncbi:MAG: hypothetical protein QW265_01820, partial [Candidatus Bathyarchaeia archaeon]
FLDIVSKNLKYKDHKEAKAKQHLKKLLELSKRSDNENVRKWCVEVYAHFTKVVKKVYQGETSDLTSTLRFLNLKDMIKKLRRYG